MKMEEDEEDARAAYQDLDDNIDIELLPTGARKGLKDAT